MLPGTMADDEQRERWGSQQEKKKADFWEFFCKGKTKKMEYYSIYHLSSECSDSEVEVECQSEI